MKRLILVNEGRRYRIREEDKHFLPYKKITVSIYGDTLEIRLGKQNKKKHGVSAVVHVWFHKWIFNKTIVEILKNTASEYIEMHEMGNVFIATLSKSIDLVEPRTLEYTANQMADSYMGRKANMPGDDEERLQYKFYVFDILSPENSAESLILSDEYVEADNEFFTSLVEPLIRDYQILYHSVGGVQRKIMTYAAVNELLDKVDTMKNFSITKHKEVFDVYDLFSQNLKSLIRSYPEYEYVYLDERC